MQSTQDIVKAFLGEDRLRSDDQLSDRMSPDAQNCDYSKGTIRKRDGYTKLHNAPGFDGGLWIANSSSNRAVVIPTHDAVNFAPGRTFEITLVINQVLKTTTTRVFQKSDGTNGYELRIENGVNLRFYRTAAGVTTGASANIVTAFVIGKRYALAFVWNASGNTIQQYVDGVLVGTTSALTGPSTNVNPLVIGCSGSALPVNDDVDIMVDELRLWTIERQASDILATYIRELTDEEIATSGPAGYWKMNDAIWNTVTDSSLNMNHGNLYAGGPSFERGILPDQGGEGFAVRFDGFNDYGSAPYHADYAPVLNTGSKWSLECWIRLDSLNYDISAGAPCIVHFGSWNTGNGAVVGLHLGSSGDGSLLVSYSTTTTKNNLTNDTGYDLVPGVPAHVCVTRDGATVKVFINGDLVYTDSSATTENGPTSSTSYGMFFGGRNSSGSWTAARYSCVTVDEVRIWKAARSQDQIRAYMNRPFPYIKHADILGYWRFDQGDKEKDETSRSTAAFLADGNIPVWGPGYVYPTSAPRSLLLAPLLLPSVGNETRSPATQWNREMIFASKANQFSVVNTALSWLRNAATPGGDVPYDWCHFREYLFFCNGVDVNYKYRGFEQPRPMTLPQPAACSAAAGAAGTLSGSYSYRVAFRNSTNVTESLASAAVTVSLTSQQGSLSSIPVSTDQQVNQRRIYRKDPGSSLYRYLADINDNTTTTYTDNTASITTNEIINDYRGDLEPCRYCEVFGNRVWFANSQTYSSGLYFSEAGTFDFPAANLIQVDRGDGDEITGIKAAFGGLVIFKRRAIHFLTGDGPTSYQVRPVVVGRGTVSAQTVKKTPKGLYFLADDGVYLWDMNGEPQDVSFSQQTLFKIMNADTSRFSVAEYIPSRHSYICSFDTATKTGGDYYDKYPGIFTNYWKLETDGADSTGLAALVTGSGTPAYVRDSVRSSVLVLDTIASVRANNGGSSNTGTLTIGLWFFPLSTSGNQQGLMEVQDQASASQVKLSYDPVNRLLTFSFNGGKSISTSAFSVTANKWTHVVLTVNASTATLYINGVRHRYTTAGTFTTLTGTTKFFVGTCSGFAAKFNGRVSNAFYIGGKLLSASQIKDLYDYENGNNYSSLDRITMIYDENTQSWAKWNRGFDYFANAQNADSRLETFGVRRGYIHRLFDGAGDGYSNIVGSLITKSGTATAVSGASLTDATAAFSVDGYGLAGTDVLLVNAADGAVQRKIITYNTATVLYFDSPVYPAVTGTYYIGAIEWYWESRWMDMGDDAIVKRWQRFIAWVSENTPAITVTFKWKSDKDENWVTSSFTTADELVHMMMAHRGRLLKIRFENTSADSPVEIRAFRTKFLARNNV